jgi:hypothetical protein
MVTKMQEIANVHTQYINTVKQVINKYRRVSKFIHAKYRYNVQIKNILIQLINNKYKQIIQKLKLWLQEQIQAIENNYQVSNKKRALLVGINYLNTNYTLNGCINDANYLNNRISKKFDEIKILTDEKTSADKPTKNNIINQLITMLDSSNTGDVCFFSYSGHGSYMDDKNNDEKDKQDEVLVSSNLEYVSDDEIKDIIDKHLKSGVTLFLLMDCCHSGTIADLKYNYYDSENYNSHTENNACEETKGQVIMISGCSDSTTSSDSYIDGTWRGAMTWAFLTTLEENDSNNNSNNNSNNTNQKLSWSSLLQQMRDKLKKSNHSQIPQFASGQPINMNDPVHEWI